MEVLNMVEAAQRLATTHHRPVLLYWLAHRDSTLDEQREALPFISVRHGQTFYDGVGFILCEDQAEMDRLFDQVKSDPGVSRKDGSRLADGPKWGPWYVLKVNADGSTGEENT